ncbi:MAG: antibiotic biosynthesis monooxygenase [Caulobacter sp.]|jgi:quinol monooxygenase YgiN|nr:antibiotic biosynthesis monooxygenase [Caulobacter sp.]
MLVVTGTVTARPETLDEMLAAALEHVRRSRAEPGCLQHGVSIDAEDPLTLVFYEEWEDRAALETHFQVPGSLAFMQTMRALAAGQTRMKILPVEPRP